MRKIRSADGTAHFSELKYLEMTPAHYVDACENQREPTRPMRVGTGLHYFVLGPRAGQEVAIFAGDRRDKGYRAFVDGHPGAEILTEREADEAAAMAAAVKKNETAQQLLNGAECEVPAKWEDVGIECSTAGIDAIGREGSYVVELKAVPSANPDKFARHMTDMLYHAQLAMYLDGGALAGKVRERAPAYIIAVEQKRPHVVTCFQVPEALLEMGRKMRRLWLERLRVCEAEDFWPGYAQGVVMLEPPPWFAAEQGAEETDDGEGDEAA